MADVCEKCEERPATEKLQRVLGGVDVGSPLDLCATCASDFEVMN